MGIISQSVWDEIVKGVIKTIHVSTHDKLADILVKYLGRKELDSFVLNLGINNIHAPT